MGANSQKHLGRVLDNRLFFEDHLKMMLNKVNKTIGLLRKRHNIIPRSALLAIYKSFIRIHLVYEDIIYDQAYNASFHQKLELLQYNACLAITGAIRGTSREKLYEELGLESLQLHCWFKKLSCLNKLIDNEHPHYVFKLIPSRVSSYVTRNIYIIFLSLKEDIHFFKTLSCRQLL